MRFYFFMCVLGGRGGKRCDRRLVTYPNVFGTDPVCKCAGRITNVQDQARSVFQWDPKRGSVTPDAGAGAAPQDY